MDVTKTKASEKCTRRYTDRPLKNVVDFFLGQTRELLCAEQASGTIKSRYIPRDSVKFILPLPGAEAGPLTLSGKAPRTYANKL